MQVPWNSNNDITVIGEPWNYSVFYWAEPTLWVVHQVSDDILQAIKASPSSWISKYINSLAESIVNNSSNRKTVTNNSQTKKLQVH